MGNCISRISKDHPLALEKFIKNKTSFGKRKGKVWPWQAYRGNIYEDPLHKGASRKNNVTYLGVVGRPLLKRVETP